MDIVCRRDKMKKSISVSDIARQYSIIEKRQIIGRVRRFKSGSINSINRYDVSVRITGRNFAINK